VFSVATDAAPGRPNEDFAIATGDLAIVVDGAGVPQGGCHHGVAWFAQQLGAQTMAALIERPDLPLTSGLADGLARVAALHANTCDLDDPGTPCAAVGILRIGADTVDALALSDVSVVIGTTDGPQVVCDLAIEELCGTEPEALAGLQFNTPEHRDALAKLVECQTKSRNQDTGWWVAASMPEAAYHAKTVSFPRSIVRGMAVFSDGATRPVDQMSLYDWSEYLALLDKFGPRGLIERVREIELGDPSGARFSRTKRHDDATVVQHLASDGQS
jgi:hypothetical protein